VPQSSQMLFAMLDDSRVAEEKNSFNQSHFQSVLSAPPPPPPHSPEFDRGRGGGCELAPLPWLVTFGRLAHSHTELTGNQFGWKFYACFCLKSSEKRQFFRASREQTFEDSIA
jgi:hypothetical protein